MGTLAKTGITAIWLGEGLEKNLESDQTTGCNERFNEFSLNKKKLFTFKKYVYRKIDIW